VSSSREINAGVSDGVGVGAISRGELTHNCLLLVDGHAYAYRSFFAIRGMRSPAGEPTGAIFGFVKALEKLRELVDGGGLMVDGKKSQPSTINSHPSTLVVVWDGGLDGERLAVWPEYKAQRPELPAELGAQIEGVQEFLEAAGVASVQVAGVEADDVIAGLAELAAGAGWNVLIASSDKDFMQLVSEERQNDEGRMQKAEGRRQSEGSPSSFFIQPSSFPIGGRIGLVNPGDKSERVWGAAEVWAKARVRPSQVVDWLALVGDAVDNVPGVPGVGPKTAAALLARFGSVDGIFGRLAEVESVRLRQALAAAEGAVRRNVGLVRLKRLVPAGVSLEGLRRRSPREITAAGGANAGVRAISRGEPDWGRLTDLFRRWGFRGLLAEAEQRCTGAAGAAGERQAVLL